jgi:hypothetical protein
MTTEKKTELTIKKWIHEEEHRRSARTLKPEKQSAQKKPE